MPSAPHVLVTIGGTFGSGTSAEIWQIGVKMGSKDDSTPANYSGGSIDDLTAYANAVKGGVQTWFTGANLCRADFGLTFVKVANIGAGSSTNPYGKYAGATDAHGGPNPAVVTYSSIFGGAAITNNGTAPQILTVAVTLRNSAAPKGPRHSGSHGRIYPPFRVQSGDDRLADVSGYVTAGTALLTALSKDAVNMNGGVPLHVRPVLIGKDGTVRGVDQVSVGNVVDTVRTRKSALREVYTTVAWS